MSKVNSNTEVNDIRKSIIHYKKESERYAYIAQQICLRHGLNYDTEAASIVEDLLLAGSADVSNIQKGAENQAGELELF